MRKFAAYKNFQLEYFVYGTGERWMLAFHGYGRNATDFKAFERHLGSDYTLLSFNLFHHGNSQYPKNRIDKNTITKEELKIIFSNLFNDLEIKTFSVLAYSIGGRFALCLVELFPERINTIMLFAPDGLRKNYWMEVLNFTLLGRSLYLFFIRMGWIFINIIKVIQATGLISKKLGQFALMHIRTKEQRKFLYNVWMTYRLLNPDLRIIKKEINLRDLILDIYIGKYDSIITPATGKQFINYLGCGSAKLHIPDAGHNILKPRIIESVMESIKRK